MFKILKQQLLFIPLMLVLVEVARSLIIAHYPETALFDRGSELETFIFRLWQITWITASCWLLIAVVFPPGFRSLQWFYRNFETHYTAEKKNDIAMKLWLAFFFGLVLLISGSAQTGTRKVLADTLNKQLHVRELTNNNDGPEVERYLAFVGFKKGAPWCAAFVSWNLNAVGIKSPPNPKTAWAPAFAVRNVIWSQQLAKSQKHQKVKIQPGDVFTLYYANLNRVGHTGFIVADADNYWITVEGNTAPYGTREGHGVFKLKRAKSKIHTISSFI